MSFMHPATKRRCWMLILMESWRIVSCLIKMWSEEIIAGRIQECFTLNLIFMKLSSIYIYSHARWVLISTRPTAVTAPTIYQQKEIKWAHCLSTRSQRHHDWIFSYQIGFVLFNFPSKKGSFFCPLIPNVCHVSWWHINHKERRENQ